MAALMAFFCFSSGALASGVVASATESALTAAMAGGGLVTFAVNGTIYLTNTIVVSNNTVMDATGYNVAISGSNAVQIFIVNSNTTLAMTNLTLENGAAVGAGPTKINSLNATGGAISNAGTLQMTGCTFSNNKALGLTNFAGNASAGGALFNTGVLTASGCVFIENSAQGGGFPSISGGFGVSILGGAANGGAIYNSNQATIINCIFSNNTASGGSGCGGSAAADRGDSPGGPGSAGGAAYGGALCNVGSLTASNNTFALNVATSGQGGGGGMGGEASSISPEPGPGGPGAVGGNSSGGAICCIGGNALLINNTFWSNVVVAGSGGTGGVGGFGYFFNAPNGNGGNGGQGGNAAGGALCSWAVPFKPSISLFRRTRLQAEREDRGEGVIRPVLSVR